MLFFSQRQRFRMFTSRHVVLLSACSLIFSLCGLLTISRTPAHAASPRVSVWLTTADGTNLLAPQPGLNFTAGSGITSSTIQVHDHQHFQQIIGFGSAMTDSSAYLIGTKMSAAQRSALMQALFTSTNGIGVSFVRVPMGSSDFTATPPSNPAPYSYDDLPAGQTDPNLTHFSLNHDTAYIIPTLKQVLQTDPHVTFMANPWSPPAWMKTDGSMIGSVNGQRGTLISSDYGPLTGGALPKDANFLHLFPCFLPYANRLIERRERPEVKA